jgi:hypothetical protein
MKTADFLQLSEDEQNAIVDEMREIPRHYTDMDGNIEGELVPNPYLTDMNLCMELVEKFVRENKSCNIFLFEHWGNKHQAKFSFGIIKPPAIAEADTPQLAIICAVLKAVGKLED